MTNTQTSETGATTSINIPLPSDLHRQLKTMASHEGLTIKEAVEAAIRMWIVTR